MWQSQPTLSVAGVLELLDPSTKLSRLFMIGAYTCTADRSQCTKIGLPFENYMSRQRVVEAERDGLHQSGLVKVG